MCTGCNDYVDKKVQTCIGILQELSDEFRLRWSISSTVRFNLDKQWDYNLHVRLSVYPSTEPYITVVDHVIILELLTYFT